MLNDRRLRDCYQSTLPPTRPQFDRYLEDLTAVINFLRRTEHSVYFSDYPELPMIVRHPPRLCTRSDDE